MPRSRERTSEPQPGTFAHLLNAAMTDPTYFAGLEPAGSGENWGNWKGFDYRQLGETGWVLGEKLFGIPVVDLKNPTQWVAGPQIRIIETDPDQYSLGELGVRYVLDVVNSEGFAPVIFVCVDGKGQELILRRKTDTIATRQMPEVFQKTAEALGINTTSSVVQDSQADQWATFLKALLERKTVKPLFPKANDGWVAETLIDFAGEGGPMDSDERRRLEKGEITEHDRLLALESATEQDLLTYAFADVLLPEEES